MAGHQDIREGMQVLGSDGGMVGRVTGRHGDHIHVEPDAPDPGAAAYLVPRRWIARVDQHVHLDREAALVREQWTAGESSAAAASFDHRDRRSNWVPWIIGIVLLLVVIVLGIRGCGYAVSDTDYEDGAAAVDAPGV